MEKVYLQWNYYNWLTIVLMVAIGFAALGFFTAATRSFFGGNDAENS